MATIMDSVMSSAKDDAMGASEAPEGCIMALDAGTTSVRAILFDEFGRKVAVAQRPLTMRYPHPGWVEQGPVQEWHPLGPHPCRRHHEPARDGRRVGPQDRPAHL